MHTSNERMLAHWWMVKGNQYMVCPRCWYPLVSIDENLKCPECGDSHEPEDLKALWVAWHAKMYPVIHEE
ncbi:MAG: hypothetical protein H7Y88_02585 [Phycisphaerales bacterium]|nr:hypothetical protein [Phycisphaerales bacterium]